MTVAYHRLFRTLPTYRWYRPLFALLLGTVFYVVASNVVVLALYAVVAAAGGADAASRLAEGLQGDPLDASQPLVMLATLGSIATMLPSVLLATKLAGLGGWGQLSSVAGRLRWRWLLRCVGPAAAFMALTVLLSYLVVPLVTGDELGSGPVTTPPAALVWSVVVILLLVPLQASAEEYVFRGFAIQSLGSWIARPLVAIVVPTVAFGLSHAYNVWGVLDVAVFGVTAAWLTWRTGGLEAAIVAHVLNNTVLFLLLAPYAGTPSSDGSPLALAVTVVCTPFWAWLVLRSFHRSGELASSPASELTGRPPVESRVG
ncbi:CPBP family intramembrane metalloprotease [Frigoribacterium sp. NBH87]|uniref:CPBP family intramembrane glutamic endopeptidase n=1 Tax=Frigoribacterium sp. NBH87 TaxID=2596916 RepID=UPI0016249047|nr:type II CAAX endopeptidase family protein [Frigoribacterium sp. NBH87]QNE44285.1 CPBP family intramembrane metalloprotease [Frigoribacterium sp. NBH87]